MMLFQRKTNEQMAEKRINAPFNERMRVWQETYKTAKAAGMDETGARVAAARASNAVNGYD